MSDTLRQLPNHDGSWRRLLIFGVSRNEDNGRGTLSLVNLAPDIVTKVMQGKAPKSLSLAKATSVFPDDWQEQRKLFQME